MLGIMAHIIFDRSIIDMSQRCDMSRSGLVYLKANSTPYHMENHIDLGEF